MSVDGSTYGEYQQAEAAKEEQYDRTERIAEEIERLHGSLAIGDPEAFAEAAAVLAHDLLRIDRGYVLDANDVLESSPLDWHPQVLLDYVDGVDGTRLGPDESVSRAWKERLADSLTTVAVAHGELDASIQTEQPVLEYETRVGTRFVRPTSSVRGDLQLIDTGDEADLKATLLTGSQGSGKSSAAGTLVEDRLQRGHAVIDLVDFFKSENAVYDVEDVVDSAMQTYRDKHHGLERGFAGDYEPPDVTVLAPLTHTLSDVEVPHREVEDGEDEPVVTPFTIPASELTFRQLVMLLPHTTKTQQGYIKSAHHYLTQTGEDWSLAELSNVVRHKTNAGEAVSDRIERSLRTAQSKSFIRDEGCDHVLDWASLMQQERHVGAFTVHMIREKSDKLAVVSYLLDKLHDVRKDLLMNHKLEDTDTYPPLTVVMRELHTIAPRQKSEQDSESTIEGYMIDTLSELLALMRHANMEVIADTQKFHQQLSSQVSGLFHRVFCFSGQKPDVRTVFRTRIDDTDPAEQVAQYETGVCAVVSGDGYKLPIKMAPPRFHHLDASRDGSGLTYRAKHLDDEYLDDAPWSSEIPPRLRFEGRFDPRKEFWSRCIEETGEPKDTVVKQWVSDAYNDWAEERDYRQYTHNELCRWIKDKKGLRDGQPTVNGRQRWSWKGIQFSGLVDKQQYMGSDDGAHAAKPQAGD